MNQEGLQTLSHMICVAVACIFFSVVLYVILNVAYSLNHMFISFQYIHVKSKKKNLVQQYVGIVPCVYVALSDTVMIYIHVVI